MHFDYDWWFGGPYDERIELAKQRCTTEHFPDADSEKDREDEAHKKFHDELEARTIIYLRDGFSYEVKEILKHPTTGSLVFECMPADESYKVGCFVVTVPFEDVVRVEIFAVHPDEKPEDMPAIKGFASAQGPPGPPPRQDDRSRGRDAQETG
ncbi:MAG: hypothetical protein JXQ75_14475 [Phycisphaerae bacterium]|nr:hypothetical protein [Phycisphaerae bacterium]